MQRIILHSNKATEEWRNTNFVQIIEYAVWSVNFIHRHFRNLTAWFLRCECCLMRHAAPITGNCTNIFFYFPDILVNVFFAQGFLKLDCTDVIKLLVCCDSLTNMICSFMVTSRINNILRHFLSLRFPGCSSMRNFRFWLYAASNFDSCFGRHCSCLLHDECVELDVFVSLVYGIWMPERWTAINIQRESDVTNFEREFYYISISLWFLTQVG